MCSVSMVGDHYNDIWKQKPWYEESVGITIRNVPAAISRAEFDHLKRQVEEMKELLKRAKKYDEDNGERDCEVDQKMEILRKIAQMVGINLDDVFKAKHAAAAEAPAERGVNT
jgi:hypothetical protein